MTSPARSATPRLPGGRVRTVVARLLPRKVKVALRRRFRGSWLFPAPPPRPRPQRPPLPTTRIVTLELPALAALAARPPLVVEAPLNLFVPKQLAATGLAGYEPDAVACFLALLQCAQPGAVIDVGANIGLYALLGAAGSGRDVRAFEPTPQLAQIAWATAKRNGLGPRVVVEELALGRESGTATLFLSDRTDSSNSLARGYRPSSKQLRIPVETLDDYCARTGVVPAIVKVDTETTEPDVLAGAAHMIATHRPWVICEVLHGRRTGELAEVMAPHGYTWYHLRGEAEPEPVDELTGDPTYAHLMYLLAPRSADTRFWARTAAWREALAKTSHTETTNAPATPVSVAATSTTSAPVGTAAAALSPAISPVSVSPVSVSPASVSPVSVSPVSVSPVSVSPVSLDLGTPEELTSGRA